MVKEFYTNRNLSKDSEELFCRLYEPENRNLKATVLILHGMMEHCVRYTHFAEFLAENGFAVLTYDHLGHGKTAKSKENLGFFHIENPEQKLINDALSMQEFLNSKFSGMPHFIIAHSMGSFVARCLLQENSNIFRGAIIVGTGGYLLISRIAKSILTVLNKISPKSKSKFLNKFFSKMNNQRFKNEEFCNDTNWLSKDKQNRDNFLNDEFCGNDFTMNGYHALLNLNVRATKRNWAENISKKIPILFVSGAEDPIGDFGKGVAKTVENLKKDGFENVDLKIYSNMRHEIINETDRVLVFNDVMQWLNRKL